MDRGTIFTAIGMAVGSVALAGSAIGIVQAAGPADGRMAVPPVASALPGPDRTVFLQAPGQPSRPVLAVTADGGTTSLPTGVGVSAGVGIGVQRLFVLTPLGPDSGQYLLRTATMAGGGASTCLTLRGPALATAACDATTEEQIAELDPTGTDERGRPRYDLTVGGHHVEIGRDGAVTTRERDGTPATTTFVLVDAGAAADPRH